MIVPPWLFFVMHMVQGYSLANAWGRWYGPTARYLAYAWHIWVATSEHFTTDVPFFDRLAFKYDFFSIAGYEFLFFLYLAYCNPGADDRAANKRRLTGWAVLTPIMTVALVKMGFGPPDPLTPEHYMELLATERYNAGHFFGHFFFTMCFAFVAGYAQFDRNPNLGLGLEFIRRQLAAAWAPIRRYPVIAKFGWCFLVGALAVAISNWDSVNLIVAGDAPLFPPMCMATVEAKDECTLLGITIPCYKAFSSDALEYFGFGMEMSHLWTFFSTFILGAFYLWSTPCKKFTYAAVRGYSLTITCALYAMLTSSFALIRMFWGVSKPLLLAAALHNLFEWMIVIHIWDFPTATAAAPDRRFSWASMSSRSDPNAEVFRRFTWATLFICSIVAVCMTMPNLFLALGLEQLFGIMLDFALPMMFFSQVAAGGEKREIFWMPAAAHTVHILATILPLVFSIFLSGHVSWFVNFYLEILINLSVPVTHFLYCCWAFNLAKEDKARAETRATQNPPGQPQSIPSSNQAVAEGTRPREAIPESGLLEQQFRIKEVPSFLLKGLLLGVAVLGVAPLVFLDHCDGSGCTEQNYVAKTNMLSQSGRKAHEFPISKGLVKQMRKLYPGLEDITVDHARRGVACTGFFLVEKWEEMEDINEDLFDSLANATHHPELEWKRTSYAPSSVDTFTCPSKRIGHISHNMKFSCNAVWKVLESPDFCAWVPQCQFMEETESESRSKLFLADGHILDAAVKRNKKEWKIEVSTLSQSRLNGYHGAILLEKVDRSACTVNYHYRRSLRYGSKGSSENSFLQKFVPEIYSRLLQK